MVLKETMKIKEYMQKMEVDDRFYQAMVATAPGEISAVVVDPSSDAILREQDFDGYYDAYKYPPSINDWLQAKCRHKIKRPKQEMIDCIDESFGEVGPTPEGDAKCTTRASTATKHVARN